MPQTGRTHQHLGFPIANDALYLHSNVAKRSKRNTTADRAAKLTTTANDEESGLRTTCVRSTKSDFVVDPLCTHCPNLEPSGCVLELGNLLGMLVTMRIVVALHPLFRH